jgi:hypothetical protein
METTRVDCESIRILFGPVNTLYNLMVMYIKHIVTNHGKIYQHSTCYCVFINI